MVIDVNTPMSLSRPTEPLPIDEIGCCRFTSEMTLQIIMQAVLNAQSYAMSPRRRHEDTQTRRTETLASAKECIFRSHVARKDQQLWPSGCNVGRRPDIWQPPTYYPYNRFLVLVAAPAICGKQKSLVEIVERVFKI